MSKNNTTVLSKKNENEMVQKTNKEWNEKLNGAKFPYGPVNELKEVFADPQVLHNDMLQSMEHPILGQIKQVNLIKKNCFEII